MGPNLLRLSRQSAWRVAALCGLVDLRQAERLLAALGREVPDLEAVDFFDDAGMRLVAEQRGSGNPLGADHPICVIAGCAGGEESLYALAEALLRFDAELDVGVADIETGCARLWRSRETLNEAVNASGAPLDVCVPLSKVAQFAATVTDTLPAVAPGARPVLWGHPGDGNVHVNLLGIDEERFDAVQEVVLRLAVQAGGTLSAEHGIGRAKAGWLGLMRGEANLALMGRLKRHSIRPGCSAPGGCCRRRPERRADGRARFRVRVFHLEYDDRERQGGFEPLAQLPDEKVAVLGLVSTKWTKLEDPENLKTQIREAAQYHPMERLALAPQCGFASSGETAAYRKIEPDTQRRKLELVTSVAREVWGEG